MSYYINSIMGKIYFNSPKKLSVLILLNNNLIHRQNISFLDESKFFEFSNHYRWSYMNIIKINQRYYLYIHLENDMYEMLNICHDYIDYLNIY